MSWGKKRLGELCSITKGKIGIKKAIPGEYPLVVTSKERKSHNEMHFEGEAVVIPLVSSTGHGHRSLKRIHHQTGKFAVGNILCAVIPNDSNILSAEYLYRFLDLNREKELVSRMRGMANVSLPIKEIAKIEIPLPPLDEQHKFVEEYKALETANNTLSSEITIQLDLVKQLHQAFLREAMQGKLIVNDELLMVNGQKESGADLLDKIKAEKEQLIKEKKIRKGKLQEAETLEELLFDIPTHWTWCKLDEICKNITDGTHQTPSYTKSGRMFLSAQNVKPFKFMPDNHKFVSEEAYQSYIKNRKAEKGDLLIGRVGAGIGETAVVDQDLDFAIYVSLGLVQPFKNYLCSNFLAYLFNSPYGYNYAKGNISSKGGSAGNFNLGRIRSFLVPLPPLSEQKRIVAKLDELMAHCDSLEESIKNSQQQNEMLLGQVLREALEPKTEKAITKQAKVVALPKLQELEDSYFVKRKMLASYIINQSVNDKLFGDTKFEKLLHLADYHILKRNLGQEYKIKAAGPYDNKFTLTFFKQSIKAGWFYKQPMGNMNRILPGEQNIKSQKTYDFFSATELEKLNSLIDAFKSFDYKIPEIISTLYAIWNNRIIQKQLISDELLKQDFLDWDEGKAQYVYPKDRVIPAIKWMKENNFVPDGWGKIIERPKSKTKRKKKV